MQDIKKQLNVLLQPEDDISAAQQRTRTRLLRAAAQHFARFGYRRASISDIADEAGVGKGTVYLHFNSKIELLSACVAQEKLELIPQLERAMELPPAERLEAYLRIAIRFAMTAPLSAALIKGDRELAAAMTDAADQGLLSDPGQGIALIGSLVADAAPGLAEQDRINLAQTLMMVMALPAHMEPMQQLTNLSDEDFIATYARILARGVAAHDPLWAPGGSGPPRPSETETT